MSLLVIYEELQKKINGILPSAVLFYVTNHRQNRILSSEWQK